MLDKLVSMEGKDNHLECGDQFMLRASVSSARVVTQFSAEHRDHFGCAGLRQRLLEGLRALCYRTVVQDLLVFVSFFFCFNLCIPGQTDTFNTGNRSVI